MSWFDKPSAPAPAVPDDAAAATVAECGACRRTGVPLTGAAVEGVGVATVCVDPVDCRRHWPAMADA